MISGDIKDVIFDEDKHEYWYHGKQLKGVTSAIAKKLGKTYPKTALTSMACSYGSQVHKEVENYINSGKLPSTSGGLWVVNELNYPPYLFTDRKEAELRVSDFEGTASNVDIVLYDAFDGAFLIDIKTGMFDRKYCTLQLNAYRVMFEHCYGIPVHHMSVLHTKSKHRFNILQIDDEEVYKLLEMNKE